MVEKSFCARDRDRLIEIASHPQAIYDLCVVGGGITGAAIARDAVLRGFKVLLVEKGDFAEGTSSRSSKLIHGGVRYLEQLEFHLVAEATRERARLWKLAPHLVTPLPFLFPAFKNSRVPLWKLNLGLWLYDILARMRMPGLHRLYRRKKTLQEEPGLRSEGLTGSIFYWDGSTDDALLTLANILDAWNCGAHPLSRVSLEEVSWNNAVGTTENAAHELRMTDRLSGRTFTARAKIVVSAAGPWTDEILRKTEASADAPKLGFRRDGILHPLLAPTRGSHIVVPQNSLPAKHAVVMFHPTDGRVLFVIPWGEVTVIGTTDLFDLDSPDRVSISSDEVDYLLQAAAHYYPKALLSREDVLSTWSGLRPLLAPPADESASSVSREHMILWSDPGLLVIAGGKLTTHREMAEQAVDRIQKAGASWSVPLASPGKRRWCTRTQTRTRPIPPFAFPRRDGFPIGRSEAARFSLEDLRGLCRTQMVLSLEDLFVRRTEIFYKEPRNGLDLIKIISTTICAELGWDRERWKIEVQKYLDYVALHLNTPLGRRTPALDQVL